MGGTDRVVRPRRAWCILAAAVALTAAALCVGSASAAQRSGNAGSLYVLKAEGGRLHTLAGHRRAFKLVLQDPVADSKRTRSFIRGWKRKGFQEHPPTAAVVVADASDDRDVQILELRRPRLLEGGNIAFRAHSAKADATGGLGRFRKLADARLARRFGRVTLFIDPTQLATLTFDFDSLPGFGGKFTATFTNSNFSTPGIQGFNVIVDGPSQVLLRGNQLTVENATSRPVSGLVGFQVTTQDPFITGSVTSLPAGMNASFFNLSAQQIKLKPGPFKFNWG